MKKDIELINLNLDDIELVRKWRNSEEVSRYMYNDDKISPEQQEKWFISIKDRNDCKYWIIHYDNRKVGLANLVDINQRFSSCYWAFYLGDMNIRGGGVGSKVEYNVLNYVFEKLKLNKLRCEVFVENKRVISMHEKFGFRREAYYREHCMKNGKKLDVVGLAMLQNEWRLNKKSLYEKIYRN